MDIQDIVKRRTVERAHTYEQRERRGEDPLLFAKPFNQFNSRILNVYTTSLK
jgi:hypothetical protein